MAKTSSLALTQSSVLKSTHSSKSFPPVLVTEFRLRLYPKKYDVSKQFYKNILQFPLIKEWNEPTDKGVMFNAGTTIIELLQNKRTPSQTKIIGCKLSLEVKNVDKLYSHLKDKAPIAHHLRANSWGDKSFAIFDPSKIEICFFTKIKDKQNKLNAR